MLDEVNKRIIELMVFTGHSKSSFAKVLDVSLPLITHITSGRNKPGMDLIQKALIAFPDINAKWLLLGEGEMKIKQVLLPDFSDVKAQVGLISNEINSQNTEIESIRNYHKILIDEILHLQEMQIKLDQIQHDLANSQSKLVRVNQLIDSKLIG
jgi:hypothetical protein